MKLTTFAEIINGDCNAKKYFWAYQNIKETIELWGDKNIDLLCDDAKIMVDQVMSLEGHRGYRFAGVIHNRV